MPTSNIKAVIQSDIETVWKAVTETERYHTWRSDVSKTETVNDRQFIEYTQDGYPTTFTVTLIEPYRRWEFDIENSNMKGHWIGNFTAEGKETVVEFTETVIAKKIFMKPFVKAYLKKQQERFIADLKKALIR